MFDREVGEIKNRLYWKAEEDRDEGNNVFEYNNEA